LWRRPPVVFGLRYRVPVRALVVSGFGILTIGSPRMRGRSPRHPRRSRGSTAPPPSPSTKSDFVLSLIAVLRDARIEASGMTSSRLVMAGVDLSTVQELLGHKRQ